MVIRLLVSAGVVVAFVWLDVRALHDIVAREPNLALEYFTIVLSGLAFGGVAGYWVREWRKGRMSDRQH
jgi:hypothetical protein